MFILIKVFVLQLKFKVSDERDSVIFDVRCVLNTIVLPNLDLEGKQNHEEDLFKVQLGAVKSVYGRFASIGVSAPQRLLPPKSLPENNRKISITINLPPPSEKIP